MRNWRHRRNTPVHQLGIDMPVGPIAGLLLRDATEIRDIVEPQLPQLEAQTSPLSPPAETVMSRQAAAEAWTQWWPTTFQQKRDPQDTIAKLASTSPFWHSYLIDQDMGQAAFRLADTLNQTWSRTEHSRLLQVAEVSRTSKTNTWPESRATQQALTGCDHPRKHLHKIDIVVLPVAGSCFVGDNALLYVDNDQRDTEAYVQRLTDFLRQLWGHSNAT